MIQSFFAKSIPFVEKNVLTIDQLYITLLVWALELGQNMKSCQKKLPIGPKLCHGKSTVYELTKGSKIGCMTYLKKLFDYEWTLSYEVSKNSKNPEII